MRVLRLHAAREVAVHEEPDPVPAPGEELVRVTAVGLYGSDLHWYEDAGIGDAKLVQPLVLGHEIGGVIAAGPRAGDRVALDPSIPCERCQACVTGHGNLCLDLRFSGHGATDGALRELMTWPSHLLLGVFGRDHRSRGAASRTARCRYPRHRTRTLPPGHARGSMRVRPHRAPHGRGPAGDGRV